MSREYLTSLEGGELLSGYSVPLIAHSLVFGKTGAVYKGSVEEARTPLDVYHHSLKRRHKPDEGRWGVLCQVAAVAVCPTDRASLTQEFGGGKVIYDDPEHSFAVPGHECVIRVVGGNEKSLIELRERGIELGDFGTLNINHGCGYYCEPCNQKGSIPFDCEKGVTLTGLGSFDKRWVVEQTGRTHLPGAYTGGFVVVPAEDFYKLPLENVRTKDELALFTNADGLACAIGTIRDSDIAACQKKNPKILIYGSGRCGTWHGVAAMHYRPDAILSLADINGSNLNRSGDLLAVPPERRYLGSYPDVSGRFDLIIDAAGHGVLSGPEIKAMMKSKLYPGGRFWTTTHIAVPEGIVMGDILSILRRHVFGSSISPGRNFDGHDGSIAILAENIDGYRGFVAEIPGGLENEQLPDIVLTGGGPYKQEVDKTAVCVFMMGDVELRRLLARTQAT